MWSRKVARSTHCKLLGYVTNVHGYQTSFRHSVVCYLALHTKETEPLCVVQSRRRRCDAPHRQLTQQSWHIPEVLFPVAFEIMVCVHSSQVFMANRICNCRFGAPQNHCVLRLARVSAGSNLRLHCALWLWHR